MPRLDLRGDTRARKRIGKAFESLIALQARLRAPNGCPWDREQTHDSLRTYLVEETYEVLDALDSGDARKFVDELGDLLLQIVFHAELAAEAGKFDIADVIEQIYTKMVRRHPHVFGKVRAETSADVLKNWEQLKAEERAKNKVSEAKAPDASILDAVPRSLPGLLEAHQLTRRAANAGFDWQDVKGIFDKLAEETDRAEAIACVGRRPRGRDRRGSRRSALRGREFSALSWLRRRNRSEEGQSQIRGAISRNGAHRRVSRAKPERPFRRRVRRAVE